MIVKCVGRMYEKYKRQLSIEGLLVVELLLFFGLKGKFGEVFIRIGRIENFIKRGILKRVVICIGRKQLV